VCCVRFKFVVNNRLQFLCELSAECSRVVKVGDTDLRISPDTGRWSRGNCHPPAVVSKIGPYMSVIWDRAYLVTESSSTRERCIFCLRSLLDFVGHDLRFAQSVARLKQDFIFFLCVLLTVHPCIIFFQMKPTRCTLLLSIFISTSVHVSGNYVSTIRRTYCIYATLVFFTLYGWLSGLLVGWDYNLIPIRLYSHHGWLSGLLVGWDYNLIPIRLYSHHGWLSGLLVGWDYRDETIVSSQPADEPPTHPPIQSEKYQCRIDTVSSPDDGHIVARNMYRGWNKYTKK